ncbi:DUF4062 domain-containing protein [Pseudomonas sp. EMN2]|uniref:DUF4062 domain-containing protein n=1 Tax=Pseudomonas sp. EMN2 TaxID=2615212 RepID=UPI00129B87F7|nr:DUF4062 domain-containing protein [Pseudomonas sp. EMN2]
MAGNRKVISFFLASPGDLDEERKIVKNVIDDLNLMLGAKLSILIELVGWEDTGSKTGRPQALINKELERCDVFIGLIWKRWGTPPDTEGKFTSGFEEEFYVASEGHKKCKKPLMSLFFKEVEQQLLIDPGEHLQKVLKFRKKIIDEKEILFETFKEKEDLERLVRRCITKYALEYIEFSTPDTLEAQNPENIEKPTKTGNGPFPTLSANFIKNLLTRTVTNDEQPKLKPFEVARFRLVASSIGNSSNDTTYIGAHDANLLLKHRAECDFEFSEVLHLILAGAKNLGNENMPLWHWLTSPNNPAIDLSFLTWMYPDNEAATKGSVIDLMTLTGTEIENNEDFKRAGYLEDWLNSKTKVATRNPALKYLAKHGKSEDLDLIKAVIDENESQSITAANEAFISIKLRDGADAAIASAQALQPAILSPELVDRIFYNPGAISNLRLEQAIENRNKHIKCKALRLAVARKMISLQKADQLRLDPDVEIRLLALEALKSHDVQVGEDEAKATLMSDVTKPTQEETEAWDRYRPIAMQSMSDKELMNRIERESPLGLSSYEEYYRRNKNKLRKEIEARIQDDFRAHYASSIQTWARHNNREPSTTKESFASLEDFMVGRIKRATLSLLTESKSKVDLFVIRKLLEDTTIKPTNEDIQYFWHAGEWQDIPLVISLAQRIRSSSASLLGQVMTRKTLETTVKTIIKLARNRAPEMLEISCPTQIRQHLISSMPDKDFINLGLERLKALLQDEDSGIRKHCALKCCKTLARKTLKDIFDEHMNTTTTYYNITHWLDFGISAKKYQIRNLCSETFI